MAVVRNVSFKKSEMELFEAVKGEDFSSYVKTLIKIDLGILPPSRLHSFKMYDQCEITAPAPKKKEHPMKGQVSFDMKAEREDLEL